METIRFTLCLFILLAVATFNPSIGTLGGVLIPEITSDYIAVSVIFLSTALTLPWEETSKVLQRWDLHLFIQGFMFIIFPYIVYVLSYILLFTPIHPPLLIGLKLLSTMPPAVSIPIELTKLVHGNVAAATLNSALGSILGISITPVHIFYLHGFYEHDEPTNRLFVQLPVSVVLPFMIGQLIRSYHHRWLHRHTNQLNTLAQIMILYVLYITLCETFARSHLHQELDIASLILIILIVFFLFVVANIFLLVLSYHVLHYNPADVAAAVLVGSQRSLLLGIPIIEGIFQDHPDIGCLPIPLLIYTLMQIILSGLYIEPLRSWVASKKTRRRRFDPSIGSKGGVLRPEITNNFAVAFICFSSALTQPLKGAVRAFQRWHLVLFLQGFMFIIFPCIAYGLSFILLLTPIHEPLIDGLLLVSTLPPSVSSCIQMTKLVHGNVVLATINSIIGCSIGLLITASRTALTNGPLEAFGQISELLKIILIIVIIPLLIGQVIQNYFYRSLQQYNGYVNTFAEIIILFLFYTALCGTFTRTDSDAGLDTFSLVIITSTTCLLYVWTNILLFVSSYFILHYDRADVAAILFVGSRKSLVLGLPIIETVLKDYPEVGCLSLPLLIYKPVQIILGGLSVEPLRLWVTSRQRRRSSK